jgi:hypothetical protein
VGDFNTTWQDVRQFEIESIGRVFESLTQLDDFFPAEPHLPTALDGRQKRWPNLASRRTEGREMDLPVCANSTPATPTVAFSGLQQDEPPTLEATQLILDRRLMRKCPSGQIPDGDCIGQELHEAGPH